MGSADDLDRIFSPRSVAVVGASEDPRKLGHVLLKTLIAEGFPGHVYPVNPRHAVLLGLPCYPSIAAIPDEVDVVAVVVPQNQVREVIVQAVSKRSRCAVITTSGFAEVGDEGRANEQDIIELARAGGLRLIGPNCEGIISIPDRLFCVIASTMFTPRYRLGPVSYVSESGAYTGLVFRRLQDRGVGFQRVISSGNEADTSAIDFIESFGRDPNCGVIVAHLETIRDARRVMAVLPGITARKPVIVNKVGRSKSGGRAAASHTAAVSGSARVVEAALRQCGAIVTRSADDMIDKATGLAGGRLMGGRRLGIVSYSGGLRVEMADLCEEAGFEIPELTPDTSAQLRALLPAYASAANPIDMSDILIYRPQAAGECASLVANDPNVDAVVIILSAVRDPKIAEGCVDAVRQTDKPVLVCFTAGPSSSDVLEYFVSRNTPLFQSPAQTVNGLSGLYSYSEYRSRPNRALSAVHSQ
jgi:acyl-CoA synthetase (NDP forming)